MHKVQADALESLLVWQEKGCALCTMHSVWLHNTQPDASICSSTSSLTHLSPDATLALKLQRLSIHGPSSKCCIGMRAAVHPDAILH